MNNIIYRVAYNARGDTMSQRFATDADGILAIVKEHYRKAFGSELVDIDIDMVNLTVTISRLSYRKICRILRYHLDDSVGEQQC